MKSLRVPFSFDVVSMNPHRRLSLQPPYRIGHTVFWWNTQTHMDVITHRMTFNQLYSKLTTKIFQYPSYILA